MNPIDLAKET
jgi:hypothetical protein